MIQQTKPGPTVHIVDDDADIRNSLRQLLKSVGITGRSYRSADEFLEHLDPDATGCIVLDVRLNGMSGLELFRQLCERDIHLPVIFISGYADVRMAVDAVKAGAVDFVEKPFRAQDLLDRIQGALQHDVDRQRAYSEQASIQDRYEELTPRERQVFELVIEGMTTKQIAQRLGISHKTVDIHRSNVMHKMQADSLAQLVGFVYRGGLSFERAEAGSTG